MRFFYSRHINHLQLYPYKVYAFSGTSARGVEAYEGQTSSWHFPI